MKEFKGFLERLEFVLQNRRKHSWGKMLGLSHNMIHRIFSGKVPGWHELSCIMHKENVSPAWLAEGKGRPYFIGIGSSDEDFKALVERFLTKSKEKDWVVYLVTDGRSLVVVLTRMKQYSYKGGMVDASDIEIVTGPDGPNIRLFLSSLKHEYAVFGLRVDASVMFQLRTGWMGNYQLFGEDLVPGILSQATAYVSPEEFFPDSVEHDGEQNIDPKLMKDIHVMVEATMIEENLKLSDEQKGRVVANVSRYADAKQLSSEMLQLSRVVEQRRSAVKH